jgi:transcriptional regulator with XRE-family HTH domain
MPRHFHNQTTSEVALLPKERARLEFSRNLYNAMAAKGWNQAELARRVQQHLGKDSKISRDSISIYINGKVIPRAAVLEALAHVLGVKTTDLLPPQAAPSSVMMQAPPLDVQDAGNDEAFLRVNQRVPWGVAIEVMKLLKGAKSAPIPTGEAS